MPHQRNTSANRLYGDLAWLWPHLSPPDDYASEAEVIRDVVASNQPGRADTVPRLLELGAGGGHTLYHLKQDFACTAVDLSQAMLDNCASLNPEVNCTLGDMRSVQLDQTFDVVLIHDAIDYMVTESDVQTAIQTAANHLKPAGLLLVAPTYFKETFESHEMDTDQHELAAGHLSYLQYVHDPDPDDTQFELTLIYLIHQSGELRIEHDHHTCGLFSQTFWQNTLTDAGLTLINPPESETPWHLLVGKKSA